MIAVPSIYPHEQLSIKIYSDIAKIETYLDVRPGLPTLENSLGMWPTNWEFFSQFWTISRQLNPDIQKCPVLLWYNLVNWDLLGYNLYFFLWLLDSRRVLFYWLRRGGAVLNAPPSPASRLPSRTIWAAAHVAFCDCSTEPGDSRGLGLQQKWSASKTYTCWCIINQLLLIINHLHSIIINYHQLTSMKCLFQRTLCKPTSCSRTI